MEKLAKKPKLPKEKAPKKQTSSKRSRVNMIALWAAVLTALGSQGVPKVVELLSSRPSVDQVQQMIATQTEDLTKKFNELVDALTALTGKLADAQKITGDLTAAVASIENQVELMGKKPRRINSSVSPPETAAALKNAVKETRDIKKKFQRANDFKAQQVLGE